MDVHCSTCGEPWDVHHLWHDAIFETDLTPEETKAWQSLPHSQKLTQHYRDKYQAAGWQFGQSVINVIRCPSCPADMQPNTQAVALKAAIEEILGDDEDGIATAFEAHGL